VPFATTWAKMLRIPDENGAFFATSRVASLFC
jgi:hypothetical protein